MVPPCEPDVLLFDMQIVHILDCDILVRSVSGHTPGGIVYAIPSESIAFTGDSLFRNSIGRSDLPGGNGAQLIEHLRTRVLVLPQQMIIFPGHGKSSTIGDEQTQNPYLRNDRENCH
jgi:glyoxylase-like metal-dependent hydrolase (beta-lactamase superfamily II)